MYGLEPGDGEETRPYVSRYSDAPPHATPVAPPDGGAATRDEMSDLYHASYRRLVAQVYAFTTDLGEAQDAVAEAFARALARRHGLADVDVPEAWLRTVAINIVRRRWRRRQLLNAIMLRERPLAKLVADAPEPDRADLRAALASLPQTYREVIVLHYLADLPVDEVAEILGVPVGTVKSRLSRGRDALKGLLDDVEAPPLEQVRQRAKSIRTRRTTAQVGAGLAVVIASAAAFFPWSPKSALPPAEPTPSVLSWSGGGLSLRSVVEPGTVPDLPGTIVEFDIDGRKILRTDAGALAKSEDGGLTWEIISSYTRKPTPGWQHASWTAARATRAGVLWQAGINDGKPTVFADGWIALDGTADGITATLDGERLLVMTLDSGRVNGVWRGDRNGFTRLSDGGGMQVRGEPIVLPDGRLLVAGTRNDLFVSSNGGASWTALGGDLPKVGSLRMTSVGYVAFDLFGTGWIAVSPDGVRWQKLPIR